MTKKSISMLCLSVLAQGLIFFVLNAYVKPKLALPDGLDYILICVISFIPVLIAMQVYAGGYKELFQKSSDQKKMLIGLFIILVMVLLGLKFYEALGAKLLESLLNVFGLSAKPLESATAATTVAASGIAGLSLWNILYSCILGPLFEELVYRGALLKALRPFGKPAAIIISALAFALTHHDLLQSTAVLLTGVVLAVIAIRYGLIWSIVFHIIGNSWATLTAEIPNTNPAFTVVAGLGMLFALVSLIYAIVLLVRRLRAKKTADTASGQADAASAVAAVDTSAMKLSQHLVCISPVILIMVFDFILCIKYSLHSY